MPGPIRARARFAIPSSILGPTLSACGDDDPSGPVDVDIAGTWVMDVTSTSSAGVMCQISDLTLGFLRVDEDGQLDPNGSVVEGVVEFGGAGTVVCTPGGTGGASGFEILEDIVENGHDVQFTFTDSDGKWFVSGAFTGDGNSMLGDVTFPQRLSSGTLMFNGSWTATRS